MIATGQPAAEQFKALLGLRTQPIAITFRDSAPADVPRAAAPAPSGCTYWKQAAEGRAFYTEAADHYGCPIGSYTHGINLPPERAEELQDVVTTMVGLGYLRMEEVPGIPRRSGGFGVAVYAPLATASLEPDVVLVVGNARQVMLLAEAAHAARALASSLLGRPTCAAIPAAMQTRQGFASLGCIGNRVYTGLADDELYFALPGDKVGVVLEKLTAIVQANRALEGYHRARMG
jgi:uncharacterized protein (DUF169 family)